MRLLFAALTCVSLMGCSAESYTETSVTNPDGSKTTVRTETKNINGVSTTRKTETISKGGQSTKTVYEKNGDDWVKVE